MKFGFIGPSYVSRSRIADGQRTVNLYPEVVESQNGKNVVALYGTPGLASFATLTDAPVRGIFKSTEGGERVLAVGGDKLDELTTAGGVTNLGTIKQDDNPVSISYNGSQYLIISGGEGWILSGTTLTKIADPDFPGATMGAFLDGYFVILRPDTQEIWISALYDGTSWNALDFASAEAAPDNVLSIFADHGELWLFGLDSTEVFVNTGALDFPFARSQGSVVEQGIDAPYSVAKLADSLFWLGGSRRGRGIVYRISGPGGAAERVSTHAVEYAIQGYGRTDDARGFAYEEGGHRFYVLNFLTAKATWVYDVSTGLWHERGYWDPLEGYTSARGVCHAWAFGRHLVGDFSSGNIYRQSLDVYDDNGDPIRRLRITPPVSREHKRIFFHSLTIDMEVGVGLQTGQGSEPTMLMRFADDGGFNWSTTRTASLGLVGERLHRVQFHRLGAGRDRRFEVVITDPVKVAFVDAYLEASVGAS